MVPTIYVGNLLSRLVLPEGTEYYYYPMLQEIDNELSFDIPGREHTFLYNKFDKNGARLWDGRKHLINITGRPLKKVASKRIVTEPWMFFTGNLSRILKITYKYGFLPEIISNINYELKEDNIYNYNWNEDFNLRDYQINCVESAIKNKRGLLQIATGGGKTIIASKIINSLKIKPVVFFVTTKDLLYQAYNVFKNVLKEEIGIIGDGKCNIENVNISTIQTAMRCIGKLDDFSKSMKELSSWIDEDFNLQEDEIEPSNISKINNLLQSAKLVIFDECQHAPADTCREVLLQCVESTHRFGLSATPFREDGEDLTIEGLFGDTLINVSSSFLIENNYLVQPSIYMFNLKSKSMARSYQAEYKESIVENTERNNWIATIAKSYSDINKTVLILVKQIKHGEILKKLIDEAVFIDGKKTSNFRTKTIGDIRERNINVVIATTLADEGLDLPSLDVLILAGAGKSKTKALQRIGRVIRTYPGKKQAIVIDFNDNSKYCHKHSLARQKIYKLEPKFLFNKIDPENLLSNKTIAKNIIIDQSELF